SRTLCVRTEQNLRIIGSTRINTQDGSDLATEWFHHEYHRNSKKPSVPGGFCLHRLLLFIIQDSERIQTDLKGLALHAFIPCARHFPVEYEDCGKRVPPGTHPLDFPCFAEIASVLVRDRIFIVH